MATRPTILKTDCIASERPTMSSRYCSTVSEGLVGAAARSSEAALRAESTITFMVKGADSLRRKSKAPSFIDSMTDWVVPNALITMTRALGESARILAQKFQAAGGTQVELGEHEIGFLEAEDLEGVGRVGLRQNPHPGGLELLFHPVEEIGLGIDDKDGLVGLGLKSS